MVEMNLSPPKLNFGDNIMDSNTLNIAHFLYMDYGYFLTKNDLAEVLGVSLSTINRRLSLGGQTLPIYQKIGRQYRFPVKNVAEFIENNDEFEEEATL